MAVRDSKRYTEEEICGKTLHAICAAAHGAHRGRVAGKKGRGPKGERRGGGVGIRSHPGKRQSQWGRVIREKTLGAGCAAVHSSPPAINGCAATGQHENAHAHAENAERGGWVGAARSTLNSCSACQKTLRCLGLWVPRLPAGLPQP